MCSYSPVRESAGGSHVYGNTLYVPPKTFFDAPGWAGITDWADELRISIARVDGRLYAFDDLCTCSEQACPYPEACSPGRRSCASVTARDSTLSPEP